MNYESYATTDKCLKVNKLQFSKTLIFQHNPHKV